MSKRTLDAFLKKPNTADSATHAAKKQRVSEDEDTHPSYPCPIRYFTPDMVAAISECPSTPGQSRTDKPDLDLLVFEAFAGPSLSKQIFEFLRAELPFYRVKYTINRYGKNTEINTPRWTTVFGVDDTAIFDSAGSLHDRKTNDFIPPKSRYKTCIPRPIPSCLTALKDATEKTTGSEFNFCLVNYYANGADSISYHSDDEHFLGDKPSIASFSFGAPRDFLLKHKDTPHKGNKPPPDAEAGSPAKKDAPLKYHLQSGTCIVMRGSTQRCWLHSIPKRAESSVAGGRINITFRRAMIAAGTENYYKYNVGNGEVYRWNKQAKEMKIVS